MKFIYPLCVAVSLLASQSAAQQSSTNDANDPTAPIKSFLFQDYYTYNYYNDSSASSNKLQFRAAIPFTVGKLDHIFRVTLPYQTDTVSGADGFGDITVFDLITFDQTWGRFGVGAVALLPTGNSDLTLDKWAIGPAAGFIAHADWGIWGLFNQNLFTVAGEDNKPDVDVSTIQPVLNIGLGDGWSLGTSDMMATYNWNSNSWISVPLGIGINKIVQTQSNPWQLSLTYQHNFVDHGIMPKDTVAFTAKLLVK